MRQDIIGGVRFNRCILIPTDIVGAFYTSDHSSGSEADYLTLLNDIGGL